MAYAAPLMVRRPPSHRNYYDRTTLAPKVLTVIHMTGNAKTSAMPVGIAEGSGAFAEWLYAAKNADAVDGPSAHDYIARGPGAAAPYIEMLDPAQFVAWSNGDLKTPQTQFPGVAYLVHLRAQGINANRGCYREVECVAYPGTHPVTAAQRETVAYLIAKDSIKTGLAIIPGTTVLLHTWINWVNRQNCPFPPAQRDALLKAVCDRAKVIKAALLQTTIPTPVEVPVKAFSVPTSPQRAVIAPSAWLYDNEECATSAGNIQVSPGRAMPLVGMLPGTVRIVAYVDGTGRNTGRAYFVKPEGVTRVESVPVAPTPADTTPFSQAQVDAAKASGAKEAATAVATAASTAAAKYQ